MRTKVDTVFTTNSSKAISFKTSAVSSIQFFTEQIKTIIFPITLPVISLGYLKKEDSFYLLQENGDKIIL